MTKKPTAAEKKAAKEAAELAAKNAAANRDLLAEAVNATNTGTPLMATEAEMHPFLYAPGGPLVEFNKGVVQGDKIAFRATALGMAAFANRGTAAVGPQPPAQAAWGTPPAAPAGGQPPATFQPPPPPAGPAAGASGATPSNGKTAPKFDANIPVPTPRRGGRGSGVYGFEQMEIGQSFYIPMTADNPNPAKRVASTVSSASERLKPKKFVVRSVDEPPNGGKGARVWRTA